MYKNFRLSLSLAFCALVALAASPAYAASHINLTLAHFVYPAGTGGTPFPWPITVTAGYTYNAGTTPVSKTATLTYTRVGQLKLVDPDSGDGGIQFELNFLAFNFNGLNCVFTPQEINSATADMFATPASSGCLPYVYQPYQVILGHDGDGNYKFFLARSL